MGRNEVSEEMSNLRNPINANEVKDNIVASDNDEESALIAEGSSNLKKINEAEVEPDESALNGKDDEYDLHYIEKEMLKKNSVVVVEEDHEDEDALEALKELENI